METICLKMDGKLLNEVDKAIKSNGYSTRTEFVREAIRSKLWEMEKAEAIKKLAAARGSLKPKTNISDEEAGEIAARKILKKHNIKLD